MRSNRTTCLSLICGLVASGFLVLGSTGCEREASAQGYGQRVVEVPRDPYGPINCFRIVDAAQLSGQSAAELCTSALTEAPGLCFVEAQDRFHELSTQDIMNLCDRATTLTPVECYGRLRAEHVLTEQQMIDYCRTYCSLGPPPPEASSPACLAEALSQTDLSLQSAGELCLGSRDTYPVACFNEGQTLHKIADSTLWQMCSEQRRCQYYNAPAASAY